LTNQSQALAGRRRARSEVIRHPSPGLVAIDEPDWHPLGIIRSQRASTSSASPHGNAPLFTSIRLVNSGTGGGTEKSVGQLPKQRGHVRGMPGQPSRRPASRASRW
jgi:hypothetical protein